MSKVLFLLIVLFPTVLFAQEVAPIVANAGIVAKEASGVMDAFTSQPWFAIAGEIVLFANGLTMLIPDAWAAKIPGINYLNTLLNWLAMNVFKNKNQA